MFKRFSFSDAVLEQVSNVTYRNSRIVVLKKRGVALPYEIQVDLARPNIRFKSSSEAMTHAQGLVDIAREAMNVEQADTIQEFVPV